MRLPESVTNISPVGEAVEAAQAGETLLRAANGTANDRLFVSSADASGLARWEADYGLTGGAEMSTSERRARLRGAQAGGKTLTRSALIALAGRLCPGSESSVSESFTGYQATLSVTGEGGFPAGSAALASAVERHKPAHLRVDILPCAALSSARGETRHGGTLQILYAAVP